MRPAARPVASGRIARFRTPLPVMCLVTTRARDAPRKALKRVPRIPYPTHTIKYWKSPPYLAITPIFLTESELNGNYYDEGIPIIQAVEWNEELVQDGTMKVDLENSVFSEADEICVFSNVFDLLEEVPPTSRTETSVEGIEQEVYYVTLNDKQYSNRN